MTLFVKHLPGLFLIILLTTIHFSSKAQCIGVLPYTEDFESDNGNWKPGGTASDWAWGTPSKSIINKAGNGQKCWIVGGLTGNAYNENEKSWLQSPCFNFNSLKNPYISFLVNWDTEQNYDGAALQYSTDNGITWESAGRYGDAPTSCNDNHWYNSNNISLGLQPEGWCGSGISGSKGWVTAYHSFPKLGGKTSVILRFVFGAGKIYNNFNGFAVDNIYIGETAGEQLSINYTCTSVAREASFTAVTNDCILSSSVQWNFDDPASGAANMANGNTAIHQFVTAGNHTVTLTGKNNRNETKTVTKAIFIPSVRTEVADASCYRGVGKVYAYVTNATSGLSYEWSNTSPVLTGFEEIVYAGTYTVTVSSTAGCTNSATAVVTQPPPLVHEINVTPADCNNRNGVINIKETGGTPPYKYYQSQEDGSVAPLPTNDMPSGSYRILVQDNKGCGDWMDVTVPLTPTTLAYALNIGIPDCGLNNGFINITTSGGAPDYSYQWTPNISNTNSASDIASGKYSIIITDQEQCRDTANITLSSEPVTVNLGRDTFVCKGQSLLLKPSGNFASYAWNDGTSAPVKQVTSEGTYAVTVASVGGCTASDTIHVSVGCGDLVFPSVFTPNGDGLNEQFGPSGGLSLVSSYRLLIYNRFGNLVFQSANPYIKWKGDVTGKKLLGTYTYFVTYTYDGERKMKKGTVVLFL